MAMVIHILMPHTDTEDTARIRGILMAITRPPNNMVASIQVTLIITEDSWTHGSRLQGGAPTVDLGPDSGNNLIRFDEPVFLRLAVS